MANSPSPRAEWPSETRSPDKLDENEDGPENKNDDKLSPDQLGQLILRRPLPPHLSDGRADFAEALARDLRDIAYGHSKFAAFGDERITQSDTLLVRYVLATVEAFRTTDEQARRYLFEDLRRAEQLNFFANKLSSEDCPAHSALRPEAFRGEYSVR